MKEEQLVLADGIVGVMYEWAVANSGGIRYLALSIHVSTMIRPFLLILLLSIVFCVQAQPPGALDAVQRSQAQFLQRSQMEHMQRMSQFNSVMYPPGERVKRAPGTERYRYEILLRNDSVFTREGVIEKYERGDVFIAGNNRNLLVIKPDSTARISRILGDKKIVGVPLRGNWVFRVVDGAIRGYSPYPHPSIKYVAYMQLEPDGLIEPIDIDYLRSRMVGHDESLALLEEGKIGEAIRRYNRAIGVETVEEWER